LSDDMIRTLDALASNPEIRLAVLTAGESEHQRHKVDMLGLDRWFNRKNVIVSGETGFSKPDVRLCRTVEEKLGLKPDELWMIGDSFKHDITGAMDSGWHTIWINRRSLPKPDRLPDFEVTSDQELTSLLRTQFT
ncbi:MAG: HAD-IA family hydrolase, partial [Clostridiales bacterium]|nr:HAD-IA family hydrolase [Clostridiales bacterium]